jgi:hypothetical protein
LNGRYLGREKNGTAFLKNPQKKKLGHIIKLLFGYFLGKRTFLGEIIDCP